MGSSPHLGLLDSLKSRLPKNTFWRNLTVIAGGTAAGEAVTVAASPILSRLYVPGDFGLLSVYGSLVSIVAVVSSLAYHLAIPAPERDEDAASLTALSLVLVLVSALLSAVAMFLFHARLEHFLGTPGFSRYLVAVPLGILGLSAYEVLAQWVGRKKNFGILAATNAQRSISQTAIQLAGGVAHVGPLGLIVGQLFSQWGGTLRIARKSWRADGDKFRAVTWQSMAAVAHRFRKFPILTLPQGVLSAIDNNVALLLFAHFFGATVTGYFALGNRLVAIPFGLIGNSAQRVFYPAAAAAKVNGTLARETADTYAHLLRLVLPIVLVMSACAPELFAVLMGAQWREAGVYMQWLSLRSCFTMLVFPLVPLIFVLERQGVGTLFSATQLVVRIGAVVVGGRLGDARLTVAILGVGTGLQWLVYLIYLIKISGNRAIDAIGRLLFETLIATAIASPIFAAKLLHAGDLTVTSTAGVSGLVAAGAMVWRSRRASRQATDAP